MNIATVSPGPVLGRFDVLFWVVGVVGVVFVGVLVGVGAEVEPTGDEPDVWGVESGVCGLAS